MWLFITNFGDSSVMLPCAVLIALWLLAGLSARAALFWLLLFGAAGLAVALSKIAFFGWGLGIPRLDFTGFSGHSMLVGSVLPILGWLLASRARPSLRLTSAAIGAACALLIAVSRVVLGYHSISEVVTGLPIGYAASGGLLWLLRGEEVNLKPRQAALGASLLLLPLLLLHGTNAPTQRVLERLAVKFADEQKPWTRAHQRAGVAPLQN